jgi:HEAT repeat protein
MRWQSDSERRRVTAIVGGGVTLLLLIWLISRNVAPAAVLNPPQITRIEKLEKAKDIPALKAAVLDPDEQVAQRAVVAIGNIAGPGGAAHLQPALADKRPLIRQTAVAQLGHLGDRDNVEDITAVLHRDAAPEVRAAAAQALGELRSWKALPSVIDALNDPDRFVRRSADHAVGQIFGLKFRFDPDASPGERQAMIAQIRAAAANPTARRANDLYVRRLQRNEVSR